MFNLANFRKTEAGDQTVLPDRSLLIGQKLVESAKIEKFKWDILKIFKQCVNEQQFPVSNFLFAKVEVDESGLDFPVIIPLPSHNKKVCWLSLFSRVYERSGTRGINRTGGSFRSAKIKTSPTGSTEQEPTQVFF